jgi:hypothetical protein
MTEYSNMQKIQVSTVCPGPFLNNFKNVVCKIHAKVVHFKGNILSRFLIFFSRDYHVLEKLRSCRS